MKWLVRRSLFLILLLILLFPPAVHAASDPLTCVGYPEPRVFLDSQAWWMQTPGQSGKDFGHVHTSLCFPLGKTVSGIVPFDIRLTMHENPGVLKKLAIQVWNGGTGASASKTLGYRCADTCVYWVHLDVDMGKHPYSGWQEVRIRPTVVEPDGNQLVGSTSYQVYVQNGHPVKSYRPADFLQGKGWYSQTGYAQARITSPLPTGPVAGKWTIQIGCDASSKPVTGCGVYIDPDFHANSDGRVQLSVKGGWKGSVTIDTTQLANGMHKLVVRSAVGDPRGSTLFGLLGVTFEVKN